MRGSSDRGVRGGYLIFLALHSFKRTGACLGVLQKPICGCFGVARPTERTPPTNEYGSVHRNSFQKKRFISKAVCTLPCLLDFNIWLINFFPNPGFPPCLRFRLLLLGSWGGVPKTPWTWILGPAPLARCGAARSSSIWKPHWRASRRSGQDSQPLSDYAVCGGSESQAVGVDSWLPSHDEIAHLSKLRSAQKSLVQRRLNAQQCVL